MPTSAAPPPPPPPPPAEPFAATPPVRRPPRISAGSAVLVAVLLAIPLVALALVPTYSRTTPELLGFPFFYWYQLLWVLLTPALTYAAYLVIRRERGRR